ncbi:hypothetical protein BG004_005200 [Podila humilis]|nr:hypothetical protein BG004_005200 [Podila humilis]
MTVLEKSSIKLSSETIRSLYDQLIVREKEISHLRGIAGLLSWDQEVMMPSNAVTARASQRSILAGIRHAKATDPGLGAILDQLEKRQAVQDLSVELNPFELANIRLSRKAYKESSLLPTELVKAQAASSSKAVGVWTKARKESDFSLFAPYLEEQIRLARELAGHHIKGSSSCEEARKVNDKARTSLGLKETDECFKGYYQVLLNLYEPGFKDDRLHVLFEDLKQNLVPLIAKIKAKNFHHDDTFLQGVWDLTKQKEFNHAIAETIGFDLTSGRLDVSTHPFTGGAHITDVRMTTRYTATDLKEGVTGTVHETGHSLYEQGRNMDYVDTPVSVALSLGVHESQSLLWERMVSLSKPFWAHVLPSLKEKFQDHDALQTVSVDHFYNAWNRAEPGFIRIEADEVTYGLHVILRYEIEKALVEGDISVADVPTIWNAKMKEYLGLDVTEDRLGCLQDTHWAIGLIGYFPTYTLGSIYAVQIFEEAKKAIPDLDSHLSKGEFHVLKNWLNKNIHQKGSLLESGDDLIFELTGRHLDSSLYVKYLTEKYTQIYDLTMTVLAKNTTELSAETVRSLYEQLIVRTKEISHLQGIAGLLGWDQEVMMPSNAAGSRANQMSALAGVVHAKETDLALGSILEELEKRQSIQDLSTELNPFELANIRLSRKTYKEEALLPSELVQASAALTSKAIGAWAQARKESDYSKFAPYLEEQVELAREKVGYHMKGGVCEEARKINEKARAKLGLQGEADVCYKGYYQALLNIYEPGFKDEQLVVLFEDLKKNLVPLIAKIKAKNFQHDDTFLQGVWDVTKQKEFSHNVAERIGFDLQSGRLDVSTHPFTGGAHITDVRMTTRYTATDLKEGVSGTVHETGHSLYEQGRNKEYVDTPVSAALSLGVHESQSLLWERMISLGKPFWTNILPSLKEKFQDHEALQSVSVDHFYNAWNRVEAGFIRVEADEVTYGLHVILRYEIEKALVEGDISVADVPALWNAKMKEYLGLDVTEDRIGCLQDTHWAAGGIGYFPTYTLGSIYAVQIFEAAKSAIPDLDDRLSKGEFHVLKNWLNEKVHKQGSLRESGDDLIFHLTGQHLDSSLYVKYLTEKYTKIYDL